MKKVKHRSLLLSILFCITLLLGFISTLRFDLAALGADDDIIFIPSNMGISEPNFDTTSVSYPATPSGFTGSADGSNSRDSSSIKGIIDLTPGSFLSNYKKNYKLGKLTEEDEAGINYFGSSSIGGVEYPDTLDTQSPKALLINNTSQSAYRYRSSSITVKANHYYLLSVWVYTCDFDLVPGINRDNDGAYIRINGDISATTKAINTNYTWQQYTYVIKGHSFKSQSITLDLNLGSDTACPESLEDTIYEQYYGFHPSKGFAIFDKISATELSYDQFITYNASSTLQIIQSKDNITELSIANGDFEDGFDGWKLNPSSADYRIVNLEEFATEKALNPTYLINSPHNVMGGSYALMIASTTATPTMYASISTKTTLKIERFKYYRISFWVNDTDMKSGSAWASVTSDEDNEEIEFSNSTFSNTFDTNSWGGNWKLGQFWISGSAFADREVTLNLGAGSTNSRNTGAVYFDNIGFQEVSSSDYSGNSGTGTAVTFAGAEGSPSITNGGFNIPDVFDEYKFPLPVSSWTTTTMDEDLSVSGIVPTDIEHFNANTDLYYGGTTNPLPVSQNNMLMVWNKDLTATLYMSPAFSVAASTYQKLTVRLATDMIEGHGAALALLYSNNVVATMEAIDTQGKFYDYTFIVKNNAFDRNFNLALYLGRNLNESTKTKGYMWVDYVSVTDVTDMGETEFSKISSRQARFDFTTEEFEAFDHTSTSTLKSSFTWTRELGINAPATAVSGIVDISSINVSGSETTDTVIPGFDDLKKGYTSRYGLLMHSLDKTAFGYKTKFPVMYAASSYVKITVRLKTRGFADEDGARLFMTEDNVLTVNSMYPSKITEEMLADFVHIDPASNNPLAKDYGNGLYGYYEGFRDFNIYVYDTAARESDYLNIWIGNPNLIANHRAGTVLIDKITFSEASVEEYTSVSDSLALTEDDEGYEDRVDNAIKVGSEATSSEDSTVDENASTDPNESLTPDVSNWWLLPSLAFAIALILTIILIGIRKLAPYLKPTKKVRVASYDRSQPEFKVSGAKHKALEATSETEAGDEEEKRSGYSAFDDEYTGEPDTDTAFDESDEDTAIDADEVETDEFDEDKSEKKPKPVAIKQPKPEKEPKPEKVVAPRSTSEDFDTFED